MKEGIEPSMLQILREAHRKVDDTYVDEKVKSIDEEIQRHSTRSRSLEAMMGHLLMAPMPHVSLVMRKMSSSIRYSSSISVVPPQNEWIFGVRGINTHERGEMSTSGAISKITLEREREVITFQKQVTYVVEYMRQYMLDCAPNIFPSTQEAQGTDASVTSPN
ncbi:hypothetical protein ISN44_As07g009310 [Arabidopsis suecica]|uniref:Uncharacterized protein n=1 Tax=Arabidopsis suecica TaxID=45249 RepID=A0A8T2BSB3_ARASU|nr:hypothetical protein ISN44_As07g009310 [Arabidopsis suecica]